MIREFTATGATVEEAIENACRELGVSPDEATPEVLRFPKKGFLGIGKTDAEVRVTVETEEEVKKPEKPVRKPAASAPKQKEPAAVPQKEAETPKKETPAAAEMKKAAAPAKQEEKENPVHAVPQEVPVQPQAAEQKEESKPEIPMEQLLPKMEIAKAYLQEIFEKMGLSGIEIRMEPAENRTVLIHLEGGDIGTVIGKRGETLDAIQYLVSLAANRSEGDYVRFTINAGNYREKREETLRALAQRMAKKVLKTGRPAALEPMNPYERRIIHAVVTEIDGVFSKSTGEEPNRKVVIKPTAKTRPPRRDGGSRRPAGNRGGKSRPPRSEDAAQQDTAQIPEEEALKQKTEAPVIEDNFKLYSKIEF